MRNIKSTKVIISAYKAGLSRVENERAENELVSDLTLVDAVECFRDVSGRYEGHEECSQICFLRPGSILEGIEALRELANCYLQDSILVVHGDDHAELVFTDLSLTTDGNATCSLGTWQQVDTPEPGEDFTKADGSFWVVR